jgi:hypothetical protein
MISQRIRALARCVVSRGWKLGFLCGCLGLLLGGALLAWAAPRNLIGIYRPSTGEWFLRSDDGSGTQIQFGGSGDVPVPRDYGGQGQTQIAVFRPSTREWFIRSNTGGTVNLQFGAEGDQPVPGDYLALSRAQVAVFRPATREWFIRKDDGSVTPVQFGGPGDQPVPADFLGLGRLQMAVFRPNTGEWFIRTDSGDTIPIPWGTAGDVPMPGDYAGLRRAQVAIFRPSTQEWFLRNDDGSATRIQFGGPGDLPMLGDFDGLGRVRLGVFRPSTGEWFLRGDDGGATRIVWGTTGDVPVPGSYAISPSPAPGPPAPPSNLAATAASSTQVSLSWSDNSSDETGFKLERRSGSGDYVEIATTGANVVNHTDSGLTAATTYTYRARAFNAAGASAYTGEAGVTTPAAQVPPPAAPSNLVAAATSSTQVTLTWSDNSNNETSFKVERRTGSGAFAEVASLGSNVTTFGDSGLTAATTYGYRVRAVNGSGPSNYSNEATATTQAAAPTVTLAADVQPILTQKCALAGCHAGSRPQQGMSLAAGATLQNVVNVDSVEVSSLKRVKPGDPDNSFLFEKVSKDNPRGGGDRMPATGGPLTQAQIDKIRQWIEQGAKP